MDYFEAAIVEVVLAGALAGLTGVLVVLRKRAFFTMALTHATFPGGVVAVMLGIAAPIGAAVAALVLIGVAALIRRAKSQGAATASGVMLTLGFGIGALAGSFAPAGADIESMLTGSILAVTPGQIVLTAAVLILVAAVWAVCGRRLMFSSFDPNSARAAGFTPLVTEVIALAVIAATVVTITPIVGAILGVALIVAPAAAALPLVRSATALLWLSPLIGSCVGIFGLVASRAWSISAGGSIALAAALMFGTSRFVSNRRATVERP